MRYGNGIELWNGSADCLVENCIVRNVYDVAYTMQGIGTSVFFYNTVFRYNKADQNEQSFEAWAREGAIGFQQSYFINNECLNAGYGWSHEVRPDKNQAVHLLSYTVTAAQTDLTIENNIFFRAKGGLYYHNTDQELPNFLSRNNKISLDPGTPIRALFFNSTIENPEVFVNNTGKEKGSEFSIINTNVLPVTLKTFDVKRTSPRDVQIRWETAKDQPENETIIEQSVGSINSFAAIAKITSSHSTDNSIHSHDLNDTSSTTSYFRLKQVDLDGHFIYSNIIRVSYFQTGTALRIHPNPVNSQLNLSITESERKEGTLEIYSTLGVKLLSRSLSLQQGYNSIIIEVSSIPKGSYIVNLSKKGMTESVGSFLKL